MNPSLQPLVLVSLIEIEEMLIERSNPIFQFIHLICEKYKYRGHTIYFSQEVKELAKKLPQYIKDLDLMIVMQ
jgi:hypothetical protein